MAVPLATALAIGRPGLAALTWAGAVACAFLAHEPLLVLLGRRGVRAARSERARAWRWLAAYAAGAAGCGAVSLYTMSAAARMAVLAPAVLSIVVLMLIAAGREHTSAGEVISAATMSAMAWPAGIAAGAAPVAARTCAVVFAAVFAATTLAVHGVIASTRNPRAVAARIVGGLAAVGAVAALGLGAAAHLLDEVALPAAIPLSAASLAMVVYPPSARRLRTVGFVLVGGSAATAVALLIGLR
jgi:hypothetical protein